MVWSSVPEKDRGVVEEGGRRKEDERNLRGHTGREPLSPSFLITCLTATRMWFPSVPNTSTRAGTRRKWKVDSLTKGTGGSLPEATLVDGHTVGLGEWAFGSNQALDRPGNASTDDQRSYSTSLLKILLFSLPCFTHPRIALLFFPLGQMAVCLGLYQNHSPEFCHTQISKITTTAAALFI